MKKSLHRVLVTGAYGFLGKYVVDEFVSNGYEVIAFGRKRRELSKLAKTNSKTKIFVGDFCKIDDIVEATKGVDCVAHLGALSTVWGKRSDFIETNVEGTKNVLTACRRNNVKKFVYISSPSIYAGNRDRLDIKEGEFDDKNRLNYYIESKILAEKEIAKYRELDWSIIRPRGLFGVGDTSIIPRLIKANKKIGIPLFGGGNNYVDMTCVENVAYAVRLCTEKEKSKHGVYNITNDEPQEFKGLLEELFNAIGEIPRYRHINLRLGIILASIIERFYKIFRITSEPPITKYTICTLGYSQTLNIDRAKSELGYKPKMTLSEGIKKYAESRR